MSQAGMINGGGGPVPPTVATQYNTDFNGPAIPNNNILNVFGRESGDNNDNGIQTDGSTTQPLPHNTLTVQLTNRQTGHVQTTGAEIVPVILFAVIVGQPGTYKFLVRVTAYDSTNIRGASFLVNGTCVSDGATGVLQGTEVVIMEGDTTTFNADMVTFNVVGPAVEIDVGGVAATTINWGGLLEYGFQGVI